MGGTSSKSQDNTKLSPDKNFVLNQKNMITEYFYNKKKSVNIFIFFSLYIILMISLYSILFIHHNKIKYK
jgi:hypothetical protein